MKTFYCVEDIERLAAQGRRELQIDEDTVLTDLARDTARQLGISLVQRARSGPAAVVAPSIPSNSLTVGATVQLGAKPKGCQHGPLDVESPNTPNRAAVSGSSGAVVDQLVDLVRNLGDGS